MCFIQLKQLSRNFERLTNLIFELQKWSKFFFSSGNDHNFDCLCHAKIRLCQLLFPFDFQQNNICKTLSFLRFFSKWQLLTFGMGICEKKTTFLATFFVFATNVPTWKCSTSCMQLGGFFLKMVEFLSTSACGRLKTL